MTEIGAAIQSYGLDVSLYSYCQTYCCLWRHGLVNSHGKEDLLCRLTKIQRLTAVGIMENLRNTGDAKSATLGYVHKWAGTQKTPNIKGVLICQNKYEIQKTTGNGENGGKNR